MFLVFIDKAYLDNMQREKLIYTYVYKVSCNKKPVGF